MLLQWNETHYNPLITALIARVCSCRIKARVEFAVLHLLTQELKLLVALKPRMAKMGMEA